MCWASLQSHWVRFLLLYVFSQCKMSTHRLKFRSNAYQAAFPEKKMCVASEKLVQFYITVVTHLSEGTVGFLSVIGIVYSNRQVSVMFTKFPISLLVINLKRTVWREGAGSSCFCLFWCMKFCHIWHCSLKTMGDCAVCWCFVAACNGSRSVLCTMFLKLFALNLGRTVKKGKFSSLNSTWIQLNKIWVFKMKALLKYCRTSGEHNFNFKCFAA